MRLVYCREVTALPQLGPADEVFAAAATIEGHLLVLAGCRAPLPEGRLRPATVYLQHEAGMWQQIPLPGLPVAYPFIDLLSDGDLLIVGSRSQRYRDGTAEDNAFVYGPSGAFREAFCLGDGIGHIGVDAAGDIWVGYFDEGVFGNNGWDQPIGAAGLVRFDRHGRLRWTYHPPSGADTIVDCYALNVDTATTWTCYYSDFPVVEITNNRPRTIGTAPARGVRVVTVHHNDVLFVASYDDPMRLTFCRRSDTTITQDEEATLIGPDDEVLSQFQPVTARGSRLYLRTNTHILLADLTDQPHPTTRNRT